MAGGDRYGSRKGLEVLDIRWVGRCWSGLLGAFLTPLALRLGTISGTNARPLVKSLDGVHLLGGNTADFQ